MSDRGAEATASAGRSFDPQPLRDRFPILKRRIGERPLAYLDNAATSQKPREVLEALDRAYSQHNANVHRGLHRLAAEATEAYEGCRRRLARFVGAACPEEIVITPGTTFGLNLVAHAWCEPRLQSGDEILVTEMEHHSNIVPWQLVAARRGARVRAVPVTDDGALDMEALAASIGPRTRVVAVTAISNVLGTRNDLASIAALARDAGAVTVVDAAQATAHGGVNVADWGVDFAAFSSHKAFGPTGIGYLWGRTERFAEMPPFLGGGEMIRTVSVESSTFADPPHRFEAGTPPFVQAAGLAVAADLAESLCTADVAAHEDGLRRAAEAGLTAIDGVRLLGTTPGKAPVVSFVVDGVHAHDVGQFLDTAGVAVRVGHHCAEPLMARYGVFSTVRASFLAYNTLAEVEALIEGVREVTGFFRQ